MKKPKKIKPTAVGLPPGWKLEQVWQVTDAKGHPRGWSTDRGVALLMGWKAHYAAEQEKEYQPMKGITAKFL
jgi:hypothetical protein